MNKLKSKKCIVCEQEYFINEGGHAKSKKNGNGTRIRFAMTCSKRCSKVYKRITNRIYSMNKYDATKILNQHQYIKQKTKVYK